MTKVPSRVSEAALERKYMRLVDAGDLASLLADLDSGARRAAFSPSSLPSANVQGVAVWREHESLPVNLSFAGNEALVSVMDDETAVIPFSTGAVVRGAAHWKMVAPMLSADALRAPQRWSNLLETKGAVEVVEWSLPVPADATTIRPEPRMSGIYDPSLRWRLLSQPEVTEAETLPDFARERPPVRVVASVPITLTTDAVFVAPRDGQLTLDMERMKAAPSSKAKSKPWESEALARAVALVQADEDYRHDDGKPNAMKLANALAYRGEDNKPIREPANDSNPRIRKAHDTLRKLFGRRLNEELAQTQE